jgi:hypothetical protein
MRKAILVVWLLCMPVITGCAVFEALVNIWDFGDGPPKHIKTQEDRMKMWNWESRQFDNR